MLGNILSDNVRTNSRMDRVEVERATVKLRGMHNNKEGGKVQAKLMSAHINQEFLTKRDDEKER